MGILIITYYRYFIEYIHSNQMVMCLYSNALCKFSLDSGETWVSVLIGGTVMICDSKFRVKNFSKEMSASLIVLPVKQLPNSIVKDSSLFHFYYPSRLGSYNPNNYCFVAVFIYVYFINNPIFCKVRSLGYLFSKYMVNNFCGYRFYKPTDLI